MKLLQLLIAFCVFATSADLLASDAEYQLGAGDVVRISVFQNPDLTTEARIGDNGMLNFPLIGAVSASGRSPMAVEQLIARKLREGGFVREPQVTLLPLEVRGNQVAVLGQVNRPGRYPLPTADARLSAVLADAGGIAANGGELVVVSGQRQGKAIRHEVMADTLFTSADRSVDLRLQAGDLIYVARAPLFYVYGEVQRPGSFRLEPGMTVMQALATGGGQTARGSRSGLEIHRQQADGQITVLPAEMHLKLQPNDVLYIPESLF